jgi:hypothetical protein
VPESARVRTRVRDWDTADELREALLAWQVHYNTQRRAEKLGLTVRVDA